MGFLLGLISSATFGLIPLFTLPLMQAGIPVQTALVYRFGIASIVMWTILYARGENLKVPLMVLIKLGFLSCMYLLAVICYFYALSFLASGVVATIQFLFPLMVMLIMIFFFHERFYWHIALAVFIAIGGVTLLTSGPGIYPALEAGYAKVSAMPFGSDFFWGITLSLLSGLWNALYFVGIQVARLPKVDDLLMTFYVMIFGSVFCLTNALLTNGLVWIKTWENLGLVFLLALVTAIISNITLIMAIKRIGSTLSSILGVMEPLTAVAVGILVFGEAFSKQRLGGVILIIISVLLVILGRSMKKRQEKQRGKEHERKQGNP